MTIKQKAIIALLTTIVLWSFHVIIARATVVHLNPFVVHFLRIFFATSAFLPIFLLSAVWRKPRFRQLMLVSFLPSVNMIFFILGIKYTTGAASQLIYAAMPIFILLISAILLREKTPFHKVAGVLVGLSGIIFVFYLSQVEHGETLSGGLIGNLLIIVAVSGWLSYIMLSKKLSKYFSPLELSSTSIVIAFFISIILIISLYQIRSLPTITKEMLLATMYMGFFGTFAALLLYQYAIHHLTVLTVSLSSYIQPLTVSVLEILIFKTVVTANFLIGSALVIFGVFLSTSLELIAKEGKRG